MSSFRVFWKEFRRDILIVESVLHRRIIVVGIVPRVIQELFINTDVERGVIWYCEYYIGCYDVRYLDFWSVIAFAIALYFLVVFQLLDQYYMTIFDSRRTVVQLHVCSGLD